MPVDVLSLAYAAHDAKEGDRARFDALATPDAVREVCSELLAARMVVEAVRTCMRETDPAKRKEAWARVRVAMYSTRGWNQDPPAGV